MAQSTLKISLDPTFRWVHIDDIAPWQKNPRINTSSIPKVASSIKRWGFVSPAVVWSEEGRLVAGHTRLAALKSILAEDPEYVPKGAPKGTKPGMLPVRFHSFGSEREADAYAIADNRLNELAEWDRPALDALLLTLDPMDVAVVGFDMPQVAFTPPPTTTPPAPTGSTRDPSPSESVPAYSLVFEDGSALTEFEAVVKSLRTAYPGDTISARLLNHLRAFPVPKERT